MDNASCKQSHSAFRELFSDRWPTCKCGEYCGGSVRTSPRAIEFRCWNRASDDCKFRSSLANGPEEILSLYLASEMKADDFVCSGWRVMIHRDPVVGWRVFDTDV